jgi:coenzyme Q-binding protein COQ10
MSSTSGSMHNSSPDHGPTLVTLDLSFLFANPAFAGASQLVFGQVSKMMVSAFEQRCLELYGPGTK